MIPTPDDVDSYVLLRDRCGYRLAGAAKLLKEFLAVLAENGASKITIRFALQFATRNRDHKLVHWAKRLTIIRGFASHMTATLPETEVPPPHLIHAAYRRPTPHIYTPSETRRILKVAIGMRFSSNLLSRTYHALYGLLITTGLRLGEALGLRRDEIDLVNGVVSVAASKGRRLRWVPLHPTATENLRRYALFRDVFFKARPVAPVFFLSSSGGPLVASTVRDAFRRVLAACRIAPRGEYIRPRLHDFRHTYAVRSLLRMRREGTEIATGLENLATYLGHSKVEYTYWYLKIGRAHV